MSIGGIDKRNNSGVALLAVGSAVAGTHYALKKLPNDELIKMADKSKEILNGNPTTKKVYTLGQKVIKAIKDTIEKVKNTTGLGEKGKVVLNSAKENVSKINLKSAWETLKSGKALEGGKYAFTEFKTLLSPFKKQMGKGALIGTGIGLAGGLVLKGLFGDKK